VEALKDRSVETRKTKEWLEQAVRGSQVSIWEFTVNEKGELSESHIIESEDERREKVPTDYAAANTSAVAPEDRARVYDALYACIRGETSEVRIEYRAIGFADGKVRWRLGRGRLLSNPDGTPKSLVGTSVDITELKRVEEELRRTKERLELAVLGSKASTWHFEMTDGRLMNSRPSYTNVWELLGYERTDDPGDFAGAFSAFLHPEDRERFLAGVQGFLDGPGIEWEDQFRVRHKDGSDRWLLARGVVVRDESGRAMRFTGVSLDITDRTIVQRALRESEQRFRGIFENAQVGMIVIDVDGRVVDCNEKACQLMGYTREDLIDRGLADFINPEARVAHLESRRRIMSGETATTRRDSYYQRKDGSMIWLSVTASITMRDDAGTPTRLLTVLQDISQRKLLEGELRRAKEQLELAIRSSNMSIWEYDMPDGLLEHARESLTNTWEQLGYDPQVDVPPASAAEVIHPDDLPRIAAHIAGYLRDEFPTYESEHRVRHKDGSYRWILGRGMATRDAQGRPVRFIGTAVDVTDMKRIESELLRAREAAESANRAKDEFLANVSHEIRTPMNAILGMTELALDSTQTDHQRQLLSTVKSAAENLLGIINELLDFSKINAGKLTLDQADFSIRATIGDTLGALAARAERKGLQLVWNVHRHVPDALAGDAGRLRQVLTNLVGNAIKFTERGEVVVDVTTVPGSSDAGICLLFTVRDTGIGIARDKHAAIFRAFEQEDASTTRRYGGTGLGLTISAQLVALMGGEITVDSEPGCGSTFQFTSRFARGAKPEGSPRSSLERQPELLETGGALLGVAPAADARASVTSPAKPGPAIREPLALRVLVAEDNELNVALMREVLTQRGAHVRFATDGRSALALAAEGSFDVLLLDLHMPELDGFEVVAAIREHESQTSAHLPIIAVTARSLGRDRARAIAAGIDDFLSKPIDVGALWSAIDRAVTAFPPARGRESRLLDARAILRVCGGQADVLDRLCKAFRESLPGELTAVQSALGKGDLGRLRESAHKLYGTLAAFSTVAGALARALEDAATAGDVDSGRELVDQLEGVCAELVDATRSLTIGALTP
jgi:PAS domain S-box-containing protein